ncbi:hypothetical protein CPB83DRAFT_819975 [Crepidotus variabilis]|uniref:Ubiquinol-cytochrome c chaperone domain-containing protein n=1 Tax=Crepidotus variabilis TaxID=179855 RepID=A0A9P6E939_9AGAR|nr:hypothetical protein CPB83DRAFT_819975 [Crepidotus variabilis]
MLPRPVVLRTLRGHAGLKSARTGARYLATSSEKPVEPPKSWLTHKVETSPTAKRVFLGLTNLFGYGSPKQVAGRRTFGIYEHIAVTAPDKDRDFWQQSCYLPPTFQSWFTVANLHIWMLTVRFRALPDAHGRHYEQALIDHFFLDIEDRIRTVLQPPNEPTTPYTLETTFYQNPLTSQNSSEGEPKKKKKGRAPDRIVTRQMKIFKEQWAGMGLAFDLALVKGDMDMAAAIWRNLLGARGAQGISYPSETAKAQNFRRSVNLVGGEVVNVAKIDVEREERTDDGSGVHDFPPEESDKYVSYPGVMLDVVQYVRRELVRLQAVTDEEILAGDWEKLKFSKMSNPVQS